MFKIVDDYGNILFESESREECKKELELYNESEEYANCVYFEEE